MDITSVSKFYNEDIMKCRNEIMHKWNNVFTKKRKQQKTPIHLQARGANVHNVKYASVYKTEAIRASVGTIKATDWIPMVQCLVNTTKETPSQGPVIRAITSNLCMFSGLTGMAGWSNTWIDMLTIDTLLSRLLASGEPVYRSDSILPSKLLHLLFINTTQMINDH